MSEYIALLISCFGLGLLLIYTWPFTADPLGAASLNVTAHWKYLILIIVLSGGLAALGLMPTYKVDGEKISVYRFFGAWLQVEYHLSELRDVEHTAKQIRLRFNQRGKVSISANWNGVAELLVYLRQRQQQVRINASDGRV